MEPWTNRVSVDLILKSLQPVTLGTPLPDWDKVKTSIKLQHDVQDDSLASVKDAYDKCQRVDAQERDRAKTSLTNIVYIGILGCLLMHAPSFEALDLVSGGILACSEDRHLFDLGEHCYEYFILGCELL